MSGDPIDLPVSKILAEALKSSDEAEAQRKVLEELFSPTQTVAEAKRSARRSRSEQDRAEENAERVWRSRDGQRLKLRDMKEDHLDFTLLMMLRNGGGDSAWVEHLALERRRRGLGLIDPLTLKRKAVVETAEALIRNMTPQMERPPFAEIAFWDPNGPREKWIPVCVLTPEQAADAISKGLPVDPKKLVAASALHALDVVERLSRLVRAGVEKLGPDELVLMDAAIEMRTLLEPARNDAPPAVPGSLQRPAIALPQIPPQPRPCLACSGTGRVSIPFEPTTIEPCVACAGTGFFT